MTWCVAVADYAEAVHGVKSVFVWYDLMIDAAIIFVNTYLKNILFMLSLHQSKKGCKNERTRNCDKIS